MARGMIGVLVAAIALPDAVEVQSCPPALTPDEVVGPLADVREGRAIGHGPTRRPTAHLPCGTGGSPLGD